MVQVSLFMVQGSGFRVPLPQGSLLALGVAAVRSKARATLLRQLLLHLIGEGSEALGQLGQDEPACGMALEPLDGLCPISGPLSSEHGTC